MPLPDEVEVDDSWQRHVHSFQERGTKLGRAGRLAISRAVPRLCTKEAETSQTKLVVAYQQVMTPCRMRTCVSALCAHIA